MARITYIPNRVIDTNGISDGAAIHVYQSGTTTPIQIYADEALTTPVTNPLIVPAGAAVPVIYYGYAGDIRLRIVASDGSVPLDDDPYKPLTDPLAVQVPDLASTVPGKGADMVGFAEGEAPPVQSNAAEALSALVRVGKVGIFTTEAELPDHRAGVLAYRKMAGGQAELLTDLSRFYPEGAFIDPASPDRPVFIEYVVTAWEATGAADVHRHKFTGWTGPGLGVNGLIFEAQVVDEAASRVYAMTGNLFNDYEAKVWWNQPDGIPNLDIRMPSGVSPPTEVKVRIGFHLKPLTSVYVDPVNGDDRNTGRSFEWALQTIPAAIALNPKAIFLRSGLYPLNNVVGTYTGGDISIQAVGGRAIFLPQFTSLPSWAPDTGDAYVSTIGGSPTPVGVVDMSDADEFGLPILLKNAGSLSACRATEGTYYWDAAGPRHMYVHLRGGREPTNAEVRAYPSQVLFRHSAPGSKVHVSGCTFISGSGGAAGARDADLDAVIIGEDCAFIGSWNTNGLDCQGIGLSIMIRCIGNENANDGFNYTQGLNGVTPHFIEVGCVGRKNIAGGTNNGSTSHNDSRGLRANCDYALNSGPGVADVNDAKTVNVNVTSNNHGPSLNSSGFQAADNATMVVDGGCAYGNAGGDFVARDPGSTIKARDCYGRTQSGTIVPLS